MHRAERCHQAVFRSGNAKENFNFANMKKFLPLLNLGALAGVLLVNYLANALPIAGRTPAQVSEMFPTLFTPAGFTFAIWGIIYLLLLTFSIYQLRFTGKAQPAFLDRIGWLFVLSCAANAGWLFAFHHLYIGLSMLVMLLLLGSLIGIYLRLGVGEASVSKSEKWLVHLPFSVYLGWVSVATIANTSILLTHLGWSGQPGGPVLWAALVIAAAVFLGLTAIGRRRDFAYAAVVVWALWGIYSKRNADTLAADGLVETAALSGMAALALFGLYTGILRFRR